MRGWDGSAQLHAALLALNALALAAVVEGFARALAAAGAVTVLLLVARSMGRRAPRDPLVMTRIPKQPGAVYLGEGFEWLVDAAEETLESGAAARRPERGLFLPDDVLAQHMLILGSTGTGKTRLLELLIAQAIARGDAVVILDPKGDETLLGRVRARAGARFRLFSLPHPERSVRYNPLGRYRDVREVADRVAALLPSTGDALPFRNFGWDIVNTVACELHGKRAITFRALQRYAIERPVKPLSDRPRDHYLKMASALIPILGKLSTELLSPPEGGLSWDEVDRERQVAYFSLGSLLGFESAAAVAKVTMLDLQSHVGARYAQGRTGGPIWLFVDELGDVATPEFINVLNKSRAAGLRVVACAQTTSDLEAALGSRARALQVLGNANTIVQFRAQSAPDAEVFSEMAGQRLLRARSEGAAYEPALLGSGFRDVDDFRARFGETFDWSERALVPSWALVQLPVFHFFARWEGRAFRGRVPVLG